MEKAEKRKVCRTCGADVAEAGRWKNLQDEYYCEACFAKRPKKEDPQGLKRCSWCGAKVPRRECHKNRHGEYICRRCGDAGHKESRARTLKKKIRPAGKWVLYAAGAVVVIAVAYKVFGMVAGRM
jgi:hypothetical protein